MILLSLLTSLAQAACDGQAVAEIVDVAEGSRVRVRPSTGQWFNAGSGVLLCAGDRVKTWFDSTVTVRFLNSAAGVHGIMGGNVEAVVLSCEIIHYTGNMTYIVPDNVACSFSVGIGSNGGSLTQIASAFSVDRGTSPCEPGARVAVSDVEQRADGRGHQVVWFVENERRTLEGGQEATLDLATRTLGLRGERSDLLRTAEAAEFLWHSTGGVRAADLRHLLEGDSTRLSVTAESAPTVLDSAGEPLDLLFQRVKRDGVTQWIVDLPSDTGEVTLTTPGGTHVFDPSENTAVEIDGGTSLILPADAARLLTQPDLAAVRELRRGRTVPAGREVP